MKLASAIALLAAVALSGCAAEPSAAPRPTATAVASESVLDLASTAIPDDISGTWYLSGSADEQMQVTFEPGGRFGGFDGCNWYGGESWEYGADGTLDLNEAIITLKGCIGERESFDVFVATSAGLSGEELLFFDDDGGLVGAGVRAKP